MLQGPYITNEKQCLSPFIRNPPIWTIPPFLQENLESSPSIIFEKSQLL